MTITRTRPGEPAPARGRRRCWLGSLLLPGLLSLGLPLAAFAAETGVTPLARDAAFAHLGAALAQPPARRILPAWCAGLGEGLRASLPAAPRPPRLVHWHWTARERWPMAERLGAGAPRAPLGRLQPGGAIRFRVGPGVRLRLRLDAPLPSAQRARIQCATQQLHVLADGTDPLPRLDAAGSVSLHWIDERTALLPPLWPEPDAVLVRLAPDAAGPLSPQLQVLDASLLPYGWDRLAAELPQALRSDTLHPAHWLPIADQAPAIARTLGLLPGGSLSTVPEDLRAPAAALLALDFRLGLLQDRPVQDDGWLDQPLQLLPPHHVPVQATADGLRMTALVPRAAPTLCAGLLQGMHQALAPLTAPRRQDGRHWQSLTADREGRLLVTGPGLLELEHRVRFPATADDPYAGYRLQLHCAGLRRVEEHVASVDLEPPWVVDAVGRTQRSTLAIPPGRWLLRLHSDQPLWLSARLRQRLGQLHLQRGWAGSLQDLLQAGLGTTAQAPAAGPAAMAPAPGPDADAWQWWLHALRCRSMLRHTQALEAARRAHALLGPEPADGDLAASLQLLIDELGPDPLPTPSPDSAAEGWHLSIARRRLLAALARPADVGSVLATAARWLERHPDDAAIHHATASVLRRWPPADSGTPPAIAHLLSAWRAQPWRRDLRADLAAAWYHQSYWRELEPAALPSGGAVDRLWPMGRPRPRPGLRRLARSHPDLLPPAWQAWLLLAQEAGAQLQLRDRGRIELMSRCDRSGPAAVPVHTAGGLQLLLPAWAPQQSRRWHWPAGPEPLRIGPLPSGTRLYGRGPALLADRLAGPRPTWVARRLVPLTQARSWLTPADAGPAWLRVELLATAGDGGACELLFDERVVGRLYCDPTTTGAGVPLGADPELRAAARAHAWTGSLPAGIRRITLRPLSGSSPVLAAGVAVRRSSMRMEPGELPPQSGSIREPDPVPRIDRDPLAADAGIWAAQRLREIGSALYASTDPHGRALLLRRRARILAWMQQPTRAEADWRAVLGLLPERDPAWIDAALELQWSLAGWSATDEASALLRRLRGLGVHGPRMELRAAAELLADDRPDAAQALLAELLPDPAARLGLGLCAAAQDDWTAAAAIAGALLADTAPGRPQWRGAVLLQVRALVEQGAWRAAADALADEVHRLEAALPADHSWQDSLVEWRELHATLQELAGLAEADPGNRLRALRLLPQLAALEPVARWQAMAAPQLQRHGERRRCVLLTDPDRSLDHLPLGPGRPVELLLLGPTRMRLSLRSLHPPAGGESQPLSVRIMDADGALLDAWHVPPSGPSPHWRLADSSHLPGPQQERTVAIGHGLHRLRVEATAACLVRPLLPRPPRWHAWDDDVARWLRLLQDMPQPPPPPPDPLTTQRALLARLFADWRRLAEDSDPGPVHRALAGLAALPAPLDREPAVAWLSNLLGQRCQRQQIQRVQGAVDELGLQTPHTPAPATLPSWRSSDLRDLLVRPDWTGSSEFLRAGVPQTIDLSLPTPARLALRLHGEPRGVLAAPTALLDLRVDGRAVGPTGTRLDQATWIDCGSVPAGRVRVHLRADFPDHAWSVRAQLLSSVPLAPDAAAVHQAGADWYPVPQAVRIRSFRLAADAGFTVAIVGPNRLHLLSRSPDGLPHSYRIRLVPEEDGPVQQRVVTAPARRPQTWTDPRGERELVFGQPWRESLPLLGPQRYRLELHNTSDRELLVDCAYDVVDLQRNPPLPGEMPATPGTPPPSTEPLRGRPRVTTPLPTAALQAPTVGSGGTWSLGSALQLHEVDRPRSEDNHQDQLHVELAWQHRLPGGIWLGAAATGRRLLDQEAHSLDLQARVLLPLWSGAVAETAAVNHEQLVPLRANSNEVRLSLAQIHSPLDRWQLRGEAELGWWSSNIEARAAVRVDRRDRIDHAVYNEYRDRHDRWLALRLRSRWRLWQDLWWEQYGSWLSNPGLALDEPDRYLLGTRLVGWRAGWRWRSGLTYLQRVPDGDRQLYSYELTLFGQAEWHLWTDAGLLRPWADARILLEQEGVSLEAGLDWWIGPGRAYRDWPPGPDFADQQEWWRHADD